MKIALRKLVKESEGPAQGQESEDAKLTVAQKQLQAVQSELWRLRIDAERAQEEKAKLFHEIGNKPGRRQNIETVSSWKPYPLR
jgi:hypothetical protein